MARPGRGNTIPAFQKLDRISEQKWGLKGSIANMVVRTEQSQHFNFYNFLQSMLWLNHEAGKNTWDFNLLRLVWKGTSQYWRGLFYLWMVQKQFSPPFQENMSQYFSACAAWTTLHRKPLKEYWNTEFHTNYKECVKTASTSLCFTGIGIRQTAMDTT